MIKMRGIGDGWMGERMSGRMELGVQAWRSLFVRAFVCLFVCERR
jgi:hypothetical protein